jgi:hypothetical protein
LFRWRSGRNAKHVRDEFYLAGNVGFWQAADSLACQRAMVE